jgi:hypothetical protein
MLANLSGDGQLLIQEMMETCKGYPRINGWKMPSLVKK